MLMAFRINRIKFKLSFKVELDWLVYNIQLVYFLNLSKSQRHNKKYGKINHRAEYIAYSKSFCILASGSARGIFVLCNFGGSTFQNNIFNLQLENCQYLNKGYNEER